MQSERISSRDLQGSALREARSSEQTAEGPRVFISLTITWSRVKGWGLRLGVWGLRHQIDNHLVDDLGFRV